MIQLMNCEKLNAIKNHLLFSRPSPLYRVSILKIIIIIIIIIIVLRENCMTISYSNNNM